MEQPAGSLLAGSRAAMDHKVSSQQLPFANGSVQYCKTPEDMHAATCTTISTHDPQQHPS